MHLRVAILGRALRLAGAVLAAACAPGAADAQGFRAEPWLEDFAQLKSELSAHYANLEWAVDERRVDLKDLSQRTENALRRAGNQAEARRHLESFLAAFGDAHLEVAWPTDGGGAGEAATQPPEPLCGRLGYQGQDASAGIAFSRLPAFQDIRSPDSRYFPIGVVTMPNHKRVAVVRIALFSEYAFPELCEQAIAALGLTPASPCDETCDDHVERRAADGLTAALVRQIERLKRARIDLLLVDITRNGGGTNWAEAAARTLTGRPLQAPRQAFIRHEHWVRQFDARRETIEADLRANVGDAALLKRASDVYRRAAAEARQPCQRETMWENLRPGCSLVVTAPPLYPQSILRYAKPGALPDRPSSRYLFYPSRYTYREGVYSGPLAVLVDQDTASSAEYFTAMLRDNGATRIIGQPTAGAGCGYTNGGIKTVLKNSGARVKIPDCVRLRADGSNEVAGITPDLLIPWRANDTRYQRASRVLQYWR